MTQRTCGNCRWWVQDRIWAGRPVGQCRQSASALPEVYNTDFCREWADKNITPEQEERRGLVRRFAVAIADGLARDAKMTAQETVEHIWRVAEQLADAEPGNSGREI